MSLTCEPDTGQCPCKVHRRGRRCELCEPGRGGPDCKGTVATPNITSSPHHSTLQYRHHTTPCLTPRLCHLTYCLLFPLIWSNITSYTVLHSVLRNHSCSLAPASYMVVQYMLPVCSAECNCDPLGSLSAVCGVDGQCFCKPGVVGQFCDQCRAGYYGFSSGKGCSLCNCHMEGASSPQCDLGSGECLCNPGVGGKQCDLCLPGFYGLGQSGCK